MKSYSRNTYALLKLILEALPKDFSPKLLVGVSGGVDSVALLRLLREVQKEVELKIGVAHFDHRFRKESGEDGEFVRDLANELGYECFIGSAPDLPAGVNLEAWARDRRYEFLQNVKKRQDFDWICTAHHRDDQAETFLSRLLSGRIATRGFIIAKEDQTRSILRPMLKASRAQIEEYQKEIGFIFRLDPTNEDKRRTRNRIRHELIPHLAEAYNPSVKDSVCETGERINDDEVYLWQQASEKAEPIFERWNLAFYQRLPGALRWRTLNLYIMQQKNDPEARDTGYGKLKELDKLLCQQPGEPFELDIGDSTRIKYSTFAGLEINSLKK